MTQVCRVCSHKNRKDIDHLIVSGSKLSDIARDFSIPYNSVWRHKEEHLAAAAVAAGSRSLKSHTENLFNELLELAGITKQILRSALEDNHRGLSLKAVQQVRNNLETLTRFVLSMEELQMKQNTIEIDRENEDRSAQLMKEGLAALTEEERQEYRRLNIKMLAAWGSHGFEEGESSNTPDPTES